MDSEDFANDWTALSTPCSTFGIRHWSTNSYRKFPKGLEVFGALGIFFNKKLKSSFNFESIDCGE